ncbi:MAG: hypothetical protein HY874_12570 [Chloroflexi bacterium]|nr:hypothetical protein [Chloroflexota bacterium]
MRLLAFVLALLLLDGTVDPTRGWLITLVVLTGLALLKPRRWWSRHVQIWPPIDARLAAFVLAILLLAGTVDPTKDWLIALSAVTGVAAFMPRVFSIDPFGLNERGRRRRWDWHWEWDSEDDRDARRWRRFDERMDRGMERRRRHADTFGDDWP